MARTGQPSEPLLRIMDVDAQAILRRLPLASVRFCPRVGDDLDLKADREQGGGAYEVVGVTHEMTDGDSDYAVVTGIMVEVRPRHEEEEPLQARVSVPEALSLDTLTEIVVSIPAPVRPEPAD